MSADRELTSLLVQLQTGTVPWSTMYAVTAAAITGVLIIGVVGFAGSESFTMQCTMFATGCLSPVTKRLMR